MRAFQWIGGLLAVLTLSACGGGGGDGGATSISVSPGTLTFTAVEGTAAPPASTVRATFEGAGVVVGFAPGVPQPAWLNVTQGAATTTTVDFSVGVSDTATVGTRTVSVRFATGRADGSDAKTFDLPITYTVTASDLTVGASAATFNYLARPHGALPATQNVTITTNGSNVAVTGVPSWLTVSAPAGPFSSPAVYGLRVNSSDFTAGSTLSADLNFVATRTGTTVQRSTTVHVNYVIGDDLTVMSSTNSLTYVAPAQGALPAAQNVTITTNGDDVVVTGLPSWLTLTPPAGPFASPATYGLRVNSTGFAVGTSLSADVGFAATLNGSTFQQASTVHVAYDVVQPFDASAPTVHFTGIAKSSQAPQPTAGHAITIIGTLARWRATADQPWIKLSAANGTGPANVVVTGDTSSLSHGTFTGHVTINDDDSGQMRTFPVSLVARAPDLTVTPTHLSFSIDSLTPASDLSQQVLISDEVNGTQPSEAVTWSVQSVSATWLEWTPSSGDTSPAVTGTVALKTTELVKLVPGKYSATVRVVATNADGTNAALSVPVELDYQPAYVSFVGSYIGLANQAGSFYVRGVNFTKLGGTVTVAIGATEIAALVPDSDTQIRVNYPALPAGHYPVTVKNAAGLATTDAELVVLAPPALPYQSVTVTGSRSRLVYDAERETLYGVNRADQAIERYSRVGGVWTAGTTASLPRAVDIALAPNGRLLIAMQNDALNDISLGGGPFVAQGRKGFNISACSQFFDTLAMGNDGKAFLAIGYPGGCPIVGFGSSYTYDIRDYSITPNSFVTGLLVNGVVAGGADGSRLYAGSNSLTIPEPLKIIDSLDHSITQVPAASYNLAAATVSGNASRVIVVNEHVYTGSLALLGHLPSGTGVALASRDSSRAYVYRDDAPGGGPRLDIYDLNGTLQQPGDLYPLLKTVTLADAPNSSAGNYSAIAMAETPDGNTVFVSGQSRIVVQPVN